MNDRPWVAHYDSTSPASIEYPEFPLHKFLENAAEKYPSRACTIFNGAEISFKEMNETTDSLAAGFASLGIKKGDRVGIFIPNTPNL